MSLYAKVAYNTIIQVIGKVISTALGLLAIAIITRYLGKTGFGQYTTIITFLSFFGIIADLGLTLVTVQMISRPGANQDKILSNLFSLRLVSALAFLGAAPLVAIFLPYDQIVKTGIIIAALSFLFIALNQILVGLFQKNLRMDKAAIAEVVSRIALVLGIIVVYRFKFGLTGVLAAAVLSSAVNFVLHFVFSRKFARIKLAIDLDVWKKIIKFSWPLAITIAFNLIYLKTDILILSLIKSQAEVGVYGAAYRVIDVLVTFPFMFAGIILPILTMSWAANNIQKFKDSLQKSFDAMVIAAIPLMIGAQFLAMQIMILVAGQEFAPSGSILKILVLAAGLIFIGCMFAHAVIALDKQRKIIWVYVFTAITAVIGYLIFIPRYSYFGAAWVTIYSELVVAIASLFLVWKYSGFLPNLKITARAIAASLIMAAVLYFIQEWNLIISLSIAIITYFAFLYLFNGITKDDIIKLISND
ncbi:flippase [Patescibacteria group bacterium]|nr:flippase [Patescibacteria group bacterium]MCG2698309.1 flippase [Candidatus Parcubacteria bacterium]MBU4015586.1 flippase [Patescibacteria group bacterium]MBU4026349.1 flippase [Patescibacteria group bacterium]MBU4073212.1 flippase [Patescibacteria group bacterium]